MKMTASGQRVLRKGCIAPTLVIPVAVESILKLCFRSDRLSACCCGVCCLHRLVHFNGGKGKGSPYSITELIPVLGSQPAGDVSHKPDGRLPLPSARPAVTLATLKTAATNFAAWWTEARWVWTVCLRQLRNGIAAAIWTQALRPYCA